ncbi:MAG: adenylate kinase [Acidimicrobiales bacterium]
MVPGVKLVVLGKQGAGKGTQAVALSHHYVVPHIATGDMLRSAVRSGSDLGRKAKVIMDRGELLSDEMIMAMVQERLNEADVRARGFVLDGCPRTVHQAEMLAKLLEADDLDVALDIEVPTAEVLERLAQRRVCSDCGTNYSTAHPPRINWTCDICFGEVVQREDDTEDAIRVRLELYERETEPLIAWYREQGQLVSVDGLGSPDVVLRRIIDTVEDHRGGRTTS